MYASEIVGVKYRAVVQCFWYCSYSALIGSLSIFAYFSKTWQALQLSLTFSALPALLCLPWFYESPRYLLVSGKHEKAEKCLRKIAKENGKLKKDQPNIISDKLIESVKADTLNSKNYSMIDIFRNGKDLWPIALKESLIRAIVFLCYIGVHLNVQSLPGDIYINHAIYGLVEIPADIIAVVIMEIKYLGRTKSVFICLLICSICYVVLGIFSRFHEDCGAVEQGVSTGTLILAIISKMFITSALCILFTQAAEIFPVEIRSIGWGLCSTSFDIGGC